MDAIDTAVQEIAHQGFAILPGLVTGNRLRQMQDLADSLLHTISAKGIDGGQVEGRMHRGTLAATRAFDDIIVHPTLLGVVRRVLAEPDANAPHEREMAAYVSERGDQGHGIKCNVMIKDNVPREDIRALHRDVRLPVPLPHRPVICNSLLALDPFTVANGATCVIPGSQRWDGPVPGDELTIPVEMDPGSIVILDGDLWHGHGPNTTHDRHRQCLNLNYHYRWLTSFPNQRLPDEVWCDLPEVLRALL